jgi:hypothetical protein
MTPQRVNNNKKEIGLFKKFLNYASKYSQQSKKTTHRRRSCPIMDYYLDNGIICRIIFNDYRLLVLQDEKHSGNGCLVMAYNIMNIFNNTTELYF